MRVVFSQVTEDNITLQSTRPFICYSIFTGFNRLPIVLLEQRPCHARGRVNESYISLHWTSMITYLKETHFLPGGSLRWTTWTCTLIIMFYAVLQNISPLTAARFMGRGDWAVPRASPRPSTVCWQTFPRKAEEEARMSWTQRNSQGPHWWGTPKFIALRWWCWQSCVRRKYRSQPNG